MAAIGVDLMFAPAADGAPGLSRVRLRLVSLLTLLLTVCVAALAAHFAIDALGDVALQRDSYDGLNHASRGAAIVGAISCALGLAFRLLWTAVEGGAAPLARALGKIVPRSPVGFVLMTVGGAAVALVGMELCDAFVATGHIVDVADAVGGSLSFGLGIEAVVATVVAWAVWRALRWVADSRCAIVSAIAALFTLARRGRAVRFARRSVTHYGFSRELSLLARRAGKRGPPLLTA
jgi:hypothetical protein